MSSRTTLTIPQNGDIWPIIDTWAAETGYKLKENRGSERLYQKGTGFLVAPMMLKVVSSGGQATLEAWIRVGTFVRLMALFLVPSEMGIQSGGFKLVIPRKTARTAVNKLLPRLGAPLIP